MQNPELIKQIEIFHCRVKLKDPFIISLGKLEFADNIIVRIQTSGGLTGFGECSPFLTIHGESGDTCMAMGKMLAKFLYGKDAMKIGECSAMMDSLIYGNTSIKSAFDMALYDIASRKSNMPLYRFLGGENNKKLYTDYTVSIGSPEKMADDAMKIKRDGFTVIKVKLGGTEEDDLMRMKLIRERVGMEIPIRIDANQGWSVETAISILGKLEGFNIEHCEEPISRKRFLSLPAIHAKSKIPIMADESCMDHIDAEQLIDIKACSLFNIKLGKSSGIYKAMKIAALAEKAGINMQAGGFLESRLGFTATAHLALSSDCFKFFDFDTPLMFLEDPVKGGITYLENGLIKMPDGIGLGATVEDDVLREMDGCVV